MNSTLHTRCTCKPIKSFVLSMVLALFLFTEGALSQTNILNKAINSYQSGQLNDARIFIDSAASDIRYSDLCDTWYYKGIIYKELFVKNEFSDSSGYRNESISCFQQYFSFKDTTSKHESACKSINLLASSFYNDAIGAINSTSCNLSLKNYNLYKQTLKVIEPQKDFIQTDQQFFLSLARVFGENQSKKEFFLKSEELYQTLLTLDSSDFSANYNLGVLYFNEAVAIIRNLSYDTDLITLELVQEDCIALFNKSLPYMQKAYALNPNKKEILLGLSNVYLSLNNFEASNKFREDARKSEP